MALLFLESIGTLELLVILVVALVVFGPRRLPELARKLARGMSEFRRHSDDFKRTWEREVDLDRYERERSTDGATLPDGGPAALTEGAAAGVPAVETTAGVTEAETAAARVPLADAHSIARGASSAAEIDMAAAESAAVAPHGDGAGVAAAESSSTAAEAHAEQRGGGKSDWL